jgi:hypothetical protein
MARHGGQNPGRHRRERAPRAPLLRSPAVYGLIGLASFSLCAAGVRAAGADVLNERIKPFLANMVADKPCAPADPVELATWQAKVRNALNQPIEQREPYSIDLPQKLALKHHVKLIDAGERRKKLAEKPDPATAIALANEYTTESFGVTATTEVLNEETAAESLALVNQLSRTPAGYITASGVGHIIIQSSAPMKRATPAQAFIRREGDSNTIELAAAGTYGDTVINPVIDSLNHEFDHGFQSQYSWRKCHSLQPNGDFDIEAANPPSFSYIEDTRNAQWQGVTIRQKGAESFEEDTATIAQWAQNPEQIPDWDHVHANPVLNKIGVLCMRYEEAVPGMGEWVIAMMSATEELSQSAGGINTTSLLPQN